MPKKQKIYAYVDESGQDTRGEIFLVSVVVTGSERDALRKQLRDIEESSGRRDRKWTHSTPKQRRLYMRSVMDLRDIRGHLYYSYYKNTRAYVDLTILSTAKALHDATHHEPYRAVIFVDGLGKSERHRFAAGLRKLDITVEKVRGARDQSDEFIRLADAIAGFVRDELFHQNNNGDILKQTQGNFIKAI